MSNPGRTLLLLLALCFASTTLLAQTPAASQAQQPVVVAAPPSVYVVNGGTYGTAVYVAPAATLPAQNTGISLSGRAGISLNTPVQTGVVTAVPATSGEPVGSGAYSGGEMSYGVAGSPSAEPAAQSGRLINDMGPSYYLEDTTVAPAPSLAEVAARYKAARPANVRVYTNADAEKAAAKSGSGSATEPQGPPK